MGRIRCGRELQTRYIWVASVSVASWGCCCCGQKTVDSARRCCSETDETSCCCQLMTTARQTAQSAVNSHNILRFCLISASHRFTIRSAKVQHFSNIPAISGESFKKKRMLFKFAKVRKMGIAHFCKPFFLEVTQLFITFATGKTKNDETEPSNVP